MDKDKIKKLLKKDNPVILEIGAHIGTDTESFLSTFKDLKIYCFEPDPRALQLFKARIKDPRCVLIEAAVSNEDGSAVLNMSSGYWIKVPNPMKHPYLLKIYLYIAGIYKKMCRVRDWDYSSSIVQSISHPKDYPWLMFKRKVEVKTVKLDAWVIKNDIKHIDFIWADIQGSERKLVQGATNTLKITKYFYTEYGEVSTYPEAMTREQTIGLFRKHNFEIAKEYSNNSPIGNLLFVNRNFA